MHFDNINNIDKNSLDYEIYQKQLVYLNEIITLDIKPKIKVFDKVIEYDIFYKYK